MQIFRALRPIAIALAMAVAMWAIAPDAMALTQVRLFDLSYRECPPELSEGMVDSGSTLSANCFLISGQAENTSGKPVLNADIYGRIYDKDRNIVSPNRNRLGSIDEIPPGISEFQFRVSIPANQQPPLQLEQFKAAGFTGKVRR
jgi:hypothetical protein